MTGIEKMKIHFVTGNDGKFSEVRQAIHPWIELIQAKGIKLIEDQDSQTVEISKSKAQQAFDVLKQPIFVDDSAVFFDEYPWFPGIMTKHVLESLGLKWIEKLFHGAEKTSGRFFAVYSYMDETLEEPIQFEWETLGSFVFNEQAEQNVVHEKLKYNYVFKPDAMDTIVAKNYQYYLEHHSHRVKAVKKLNEYLRQRFGLE